MPRKREGVIKESLHQLEQLETRFHGKPQHPRIQALRLLKQQPTLRLEDVGDMVGVSGKTVKRWWKIYREGGLNALRNVSPATKQAVEGNGRLMELKRKLLGGDFADVDDVLAWLGRSGDHEVTPSQGIARSYELNGNTVDHFIRFLNQLPASFAIDQWTICFRDALHHFLGDVDRVMLGLSAQVDLLRPESNIENLTVTQHIAQDSTSVLVSPERELQPLERQLENLRHRNFPFDEYHPPKTFIYFYSEQVYVGTVFLWRKRTNRPISDQTIRIMHELEPFIVFMFTDAICRFRYGKPTDSAFNESIIQLASVAGLTPAERRVLILQLLGFSYDEMASTLSISLNTVRYHLKSIYNKTDTHSLSELFAKYFTPRLKTDKAHE